MTLFELAATLVLDTSEFVGGITQSESLWSKFGAALTGGLSGIGSAVKEVFSSSSWGSIGSKIRSLADEASAAGDKIDKQSQALGMSRQAYQEWDYILGQSGASIDSLGVSMKTLNSAVLSVLDDPKKNKDMVEIFDELGLSIAELNGLTQESQFERVVRAFQQLPAGAEKSALAVKLFGRNGQDLLPLLNSSSDSIDELRARAEELGIVMSDDMIDAAVAYNDALDDMSRAFNAVKLTVGAEFMPLLTKLFTKTATFTGTLLNAYKEGGIVGVAKKALEGLGDLIVSVGLPTPSDILSKAVDWWDGGEGVRNLLETACKWTLRIFGMPEESAETIAQNVGTWWSTVVSNVEDVCEWFLHAAQNPQETGEQVGALVKSWWEKGSGAPKSAVEAACSWTLQLFGVPQDDAATIVANVQTWWDGTTRSLVESACSWTLQFFGLSPDFSDKAATLIADGLKAATGAINIGTKLIMDIPALLFGNAQPMADDIASFWDDSVLPLLNDLLLPFGIELPSASEIAGKIRTRWEEAKRFVGNLFFGADVEIDVHQSSAGQVHAGGSRTYGASEGSGGTNYLQLESDYANTIPNYAQKFATGLDYVPYNEFPAYLHEGEAVLTKSEATEWRNGGQTGFDASEFAAIVAGAIRDGMQGFGFYVDSRRLADATTDQISRNIAAAAIAGRYTV